MNNQSGFDDIINNVIDYATNNINCLFIGKISKLEPPFARIQPLALNNGQKEPPIDKVPFLTVPIRYTKKYNDDTDNHTTPKEMKLTQPKLDYHKGDNVICGVLDVDDMYFKNKDTFKVDSNRMHSLDFSVVLGKYATKDDFYKGSDK